ncbi:ribokinase [Bacteroidia bacterium]|nr:ribokinase [Bacteroidia bacterium]
MTKKICVFGSFVTDLTARTEKFPKPGETVKGKSFKMGPGGKGSNQAVAAKRAGADVTFITRLGDDALGRQALEFYKNENMSVDAILIDKENPTGAALISVNESTAQNEIVVVSGACEHFTEEELPDILELVGHSDIVLLQLETNYEPVQAILKFAKENNIVTILNPAPAGILPAEFMQCVDIITPNETEAEVITGISVTDENSAQNAANTLIGMGAGKVVITLGDKGCYAYDGLSGRLIGVVNAGKVVDTTGAGDAFSGGLAAAISFGMDFFTAVRYASTVAGLSVTKQGTAPAMPYKSEIDEIFRE